MLKSERVNLSIKDEMKEKRTLSCTQTKRQMDGQLLLELLTEPKAKLLIFSGLKFKNYYFVL